MKNYSRKTHSPRCSECGTKLSKYGTRISRSRGKLQRYICPDCGRVYQRKKR